MTLQKARNVRSLVCACIARALLLLVAVLLVVMPWTEYFCNFDKFLRGGQDFELGLLCVLTVLCLVLVLFQHGRKLVTHLLSLRRWLMELARLGERPAFGDLCERLALCCRAVMPDCTIDRCSLPLRI